MDYAPSVGNARPWRVISVESSVKRAAVHDIFLKANRSAAQIYEGSRAEHYRDLKLEGINVAPLQLAIFTETAPLKDMASADNPCPSLWNTARRWRSRISIWQQDRSDSVSVWFPFSIHTQWKRFSKSSQAGASASIFASAGLRLPRQMTTRLCSTRTAGRKTSQRSGNAPDDCLLQGMAAMRILVI